MTNRLQYCWIIFILFKINVRICVFAQTRINMWSCLADSWRNFWRHHSDQYHRYFAEVCHNLTPMRSTWPIKQDLNTLYQLKRWDMGYIFHHVFASVGTGQNLLDKNRAAGDLKDLDAHVTSMWRMFFPVNQVPVVSYHPPPPPPTQIASMNTYSQANQKTALQQHHIPLHRCSLGPWNIPI